MVNARPTSQSSIVENRRMTGGPGDFMTVHHLTLAGNQADIGKGLAEVAWEDSHWEPTPAQNQARNRARRRWFEKHWPEQYARMVGVAMAFGQDIEDDRLDFSCAVAAEQ